MNARIGEVQDGLGEGSSVILVMKEESKSYICPLSVVNVVITRVVISIVLCFSHPQPDHQTTTRLASPLDSVGPNY